MFDVRRVRRDFPMLGAQMNGKPLIYLDTAATAQKPQSVIDAVTNYYQNEYATVHRAIYELAARSTESYTSVRTKVKTFINAECDEEIVFTSSTTNALNLLANTLGRTILQPGDTILITDMEHHSNIVPWQLIAEQTGATLQSIPLTPTGELDLTSLDTLLTEHTKIVALTHVSNVLGTINPIAEIIERAQTVGAHTIIDAAQSAPHMPIDVTDLDCDFLVFSGHKLFGPTGVGILYGKKAILDNLPPYQGGGDMIKTVTLEKTTYQQGPLKFEAGTPPIAQVLGLGAAIDYLTTIGLENILDYENKLLAYATQKLQTVPGLTIHGTSPTKGPIISFTIENMHPLDIGTVLSLKGIAIRTGHMCTQPLLKTLGHTSLCRISLAFYNTIQEIDILTEQLKESLIFLQPQLSY
ncbi:MAG: Cysteine desulfurase [Chlamydiia bacterium]|nr:Cysteine desulfurase [Chlamydiia bacterium]MCH9616215.1 Cysteine desulfurase [Chlamydiia bacterium]MCH9629799.1 Cysteine desulfurase [Chlamydiia bacterium]